MTLFRKLLIVLAIFCIAWPAIAQENKDNPGYFETPGFIALGASFSPRNRSSMRRDNTPAPYLWGAYNIAQSEFGNIALVAGVQYSRPGRNYDGSIPFEIKSDFVTGDVGIGYFTAATTWNFFIGAGYSFGWLKMSLSADNRYSTSYQKSPHGVFYFAGLEYGLTKDGRWGLFIILNGRELKNTTFEYDDGQGFAGSKFINVSNQVVSVGIAHHF